MTIPLARFRSPAALVVAAALLIAPTLFAQKSTSIEGKGPRGGGPGVASPTPTPSGPAKPAPGAMVYEKLFKGMQVRQIGPFRGGRALAVEGVVGEPDVYYFGAVGGGVWKTTDGGANWSPLFDKQDISSIGAIAVAPSDHNVLDRGTGDTFIRGNTLMGTGIYP